VVLDDAVNPALELVKALNVKAGVEVLSRRRLNLIEVPLHPDQVSLRALELLEVLRLQVVLVLA
jgi:hypothetical protein